MPVTVAVDANGADLGPAEVAAGAAIAAAAGRPRRCSSGPPSRSARSPTASRSSTRPSRSPRRADPARAVPREARRLDRPRRARRRRGRRRRASSAAARPAPRWPPALFNIKRAAGIYRPALAIPVPVPGAPGHALDVGANTEVRAEHLVQFALHGRRAGPGRARRRAPARRPALQRRGGDARARRSSSRRTPRCATALAERRRASTSSATSRAPTSPTGEADVVVTDGFTGNVALKLMEGVSQAMLGADPRRGDVVAPRAKAGGLLLRPALRGLRDEHRSRERRAAPTCSGLRRLGVVPHGRFSALRLRAGDPARRARRRRRRRRAARTRRWRPRGALRPAAGCPDRRVYGCRRHDPRRGLQR